MEAVLESVADEVPGLRLNQTDRITLPIILAFADDLIIIVDNCYRQFGTTVGFPAEKS